MTNSDLFKTTIAGIRKEESELPKRDHPAGHEGPTMPPGFIRAVFASSEIDERCSITINGSWHDEEVVQGLLENAGDSFPYGDCANVPLTSWIADDDHFPPIHPSFGCKVIGIEDDHILTDESKGDDH